MTWSMVDVLRRGQDRSPGQLRLRLPRYPWIGEVVLLLKERLNREGWTTPA
jgi:hypothetical protein